MRLLNVSSLTFQEFEEPNIPKYAIASHRWHAGSEVFLRDMIKRREMGSLGYLKIQGFCTFVRDNLKGIDWLWMDTCCIEQRNCTEVCLAVNSMFKWYKNAAVCLAYLADVTGDGKDTMDQLRRSEWFQRGWTLQELLAPEVVVLLSNNWKVIGHKGAGEELAQDTLVRGPGPSLTRDISEITQIPETVLSDYNRSNEYSVEAKINWRGSRKTTRPEDLAYCMFGIFNVHLSPIYGEGAARATDRLGEEIRRLMWTAPAKRDSFVRPNFSLVGTAFNKARPQAVKDQTLTAISPLERPAMINTKDPPLSESRRRSDSIKSSRSKPPADALPCYQIIETPKVDDSKYKYFLDGQALSTYIVKRYFRSIAESPTELRCVRYQDRDGYLINGPLLTDEHLASLWRQSREHELMRRVDKCLISANQGLNHLPQRV